MKILWLLLIIPTVLGQAGFGKSYLRNSRLCHQWNCINTHLGFPDALPPQSQTEEALKRLLPHGPWQDVLPKVLEYCYSSRRKQFTNTCPGQAVLHCVVDQMIENCPEQSHKKSDACSPVTSLAGLKYMFGQSRYNNLEINLPKEMRPTWFLEKFFDTKCCDLPQLFNTTLLEECGFSSFISYFTDIPVIDNSRVVTPVPVASVSTQENVDTLKIVDLNQPDKSSPVDLFECCDMSDFIKPEWRTECDFKLSWGGAERLVVGNESVVTTEAPTTTTAATEQPKDLMMVPHSCEKETCVFRNLGIITSTGTLDRDAYITMLNNFTISHPAYTRAKSRVISKCLGKKLWDYEADCEINKILACTLDILTENCPYKTKHSDGCKHNTHKGGCQISSSKFRPKYRREICLIPELFSHNHLSNCGIDSVYRSEHVAVPAAKPRKHGWMATTQLCQDSTPPSTCIMDKMGILNKYNFMDYFKMKDRIRRFVSDKAEWSALLDIYMSAYINVPMYKKYCSSQRKMLNVLDSMLMTCPVSKRKNTPQCNQVFTNMLNTTPLDNQNVTKAKIDEILNHYKQVFMQPARVRYNKVHRKKHNSKKPIFNYGILDSKNTPEVSIINVKPTVVTKSNKPLIILPVYMRPKPPTMTPLLASPYNDGIFRNNPFWLQDRMAKVHFTTTHAPVVTSEHSNLQVVPRNKSLLPVFNDILGDKPLDIMKP